MKDSIVESTDLSGLTRMSTGKVRDMYLYEDQVLLVATDRISAFDVVLGNGIPHKGKVLTKLSAYWFDLTADIVENHCITADFEQFPAALKEFELIEGRGMLCRRSDVLPIECIVRGHLEGSAWKAYKSNGKICGIPLPKGLERRSRLAEPIFTPSTKATTGHDENITFQEMVNIVGVETADLASSYSLDLFNFAYNHLAERGIVLADTKFEFGWYNEKLILIDEVFTPDSSRFWIKGAVSSDGSPISYDKQFVRDYLESISWDKKPPAPTLPAEIVVKTSERYVEIYERITGKIFVK